MHIDNRIKQSYKNTFLKQRCVLLKDYALYVLLAISCCLACSSPDLYISEPSTKDASVTFSLVLPRLTPTKTYTDDLSVAKDDEVDHVTLLVFAANDEQTGQFLYSKTKLNVSAANKFTVDLELTNSAVRVHIFANAPAGSLADTYQGKIEKEVLESIETNIDLNHSSTYTIPMHGCFELASVLPGNITEEVQLLRSVARVDVQVNDKIDLNTFKLSGVAVYFTPNKGCLVSNSVLVGNQNPYVTSPTMPMTEYEILGTKETAPSAHIMNSNYSSILNNLFIYENQDYTNIVGDKKNSRIIISGYYNGSTQLSYYPVDFQQTNDADNKEYIPVLRNHKYLLTIISVMGDGYTDEELAANSEPIDITASITWDKPTEYIIFEGKNYFHIERRSLTLYGDDGVQDSLLVGSNIDPTEWEMSWDSDEDYKKTKKLTGSHFTVEKPTVKEGGFLKFATRNQYIEDIDRFLYIRVANRLKLKVTVSQRRGILTVDAQRGTIDVAAMYYGGLYRFHVLTGNTSIGWKALPDASTLVTMIDDYNSIGNDDEYLTVNIKSNWGENEREGVITVSRSSGSSVDAVTLKIIQERAPYLTISPAFLNPLAAPTKLTDKVKPTPYDYTITVSDPSRYTWQATTTFAQSDVSLGNIAGDAKEVVFGASGEQLRIYVEGRTSEQFDGIGKIKLALVRKTTHLPISAGKKVKDLTVAAYVTVSTGGGNGIYIYDRNMGEKVPDADTSAEYYTNKDREKNPEFRGDLYTWANAQTICEEKIGTGWRLPTKDEYEYIIAHPLQYDNSLHGAAYIQDGNIRCYFPLSGNDQVDQPFYEHADYWSGTTGKDQEKAWAFCLQMHPGTTVYEDFKYRGFYIRCVKSIP